MTSRDAFFQHPQALVESTKIGAGTRVWAFAHVLPGAVIGRDCNICDHVFVENDVTVGDRVTIKCGVQLWDGIRIEDDVFVGPNATFTNDPFPRSRQHLDRYPETRIERGASIGANATILPALTVGQHAMVGAGAVVTHTVPPYAVVAGNPARVQGFVTVPGSNHPATALAPAAAGTEVHRTELVRVPLIQDLCGSSVALAGAEALPFAPARCVVVTDSVSESACSQHAYRRCAQLLVCLRGSVVVQCEAGQNRQELLLESLGLGLYVAPMVWCWRLQLSRDAVLLVLASHPWDPGDEIRDYDQFLAECRG